MMLASTERLISATKNILFSLLKVISFGMLCSHFAEVVTFHQRHIVWEDAFYVVVRSVSRTTFSINYIV